MTISTSSIKPRAVGAHSEVKRLILLILGPLLMSGCAQANPGLGPVLAEGLEPLPASGAEAWVTYADHLVEIQIDTEKRLEPTKDEIEAEEGLIPRVVTATVVSTLWSRPGTKATAPSTVTWGAGGWVFEGDKQQELRLDGVPWLVVGHRYLVPIAYTALVADTSDPPRWIPLGAKNAMPYDNQIIGHGEEILTGGESYKGSDPSGETDVRDLVWGKNGDDAAEILRATSPDTAAAKYMNLSAINRYTAVLRDTYPPESPDPRETGPTTIPMVTPR